MDREKTVEEELHLFPSYLKSRLDCRTLTKRKLQQIIGRITSELETYDTDVQILRELNLLAFLHHELGDKHEALKYISESSSLKARNINALVLKSWFSLNSSDIYESEKVLLDIKTLCDDQIEVIHAKAELAYIYTRLGVNFYDKAEDIFKALFDEIETEKVSVDPNVIFIWKFGLTLIRKRTLNFHNLTEENKFDITIERITQVFKNYSELLSIHQIDNKSRARLLVEMGELVHNANWKIPKKFHHDRSKLEIFDRQATDYFEEALTYSDSDPFVLNRCGKHYKFKPDTVHKAVELLEKSVSICETSFAHHHLALSLKRKLEFTHQSNTFPKGGKQQHDVQNTSSTHVINIWPRPPDTRDSLNRNDTAAAKGQNPKPRMVDFVVNTENLPGILQCGNTIDTKSIHQQATARPTMESSSMPLRAVGGIDGTTLNTVVDVDRSWSADNTRHLRNEPNEDLTSGFERMNLYPRSRGSYSALMRNQPQPLGRYVGIRVMSSMGNDGINDRYTRPFNFNQSYGRQTRGQNKRFTDDSSQPRGRSTGKQAMAYISNVGSNVRYTSSFNSYQGCGRQRQGQYKRCSGDRSVEWDNTRITETYIKSPSKIKYLERSDAGSIDEILEHLDKAFKLSENLSAVYDKGLILRALRRYDEAIDAFKLCFRDVSAPSLVLLANAYEQSALCLKDKLEGLPQSETTEKMNHNLKHYLQASIEICYKRLMPKYHDLQYCWSSQRILEEMLHNKDRTKESLSELHELYSKIQMHSKDNKLLTELLELEENKENRNVLYIEKIRNHCKLQNYDDAILTSSLMGDQMNDQPLFQEIHIEGGFQSYIKNENELAKLRFKSSLDKCRDIEADVEGQNEKTFQVFILCSNEDSPQHLKEGLAKLGLEVTVNFEDLLIADSKSTGIEKVMKRSTHFVVFFEQETTLGDIEKMKHHGEMIRQVCVQRGYGNVVVMKKDEHVEVPLTFADKPFVIYDDDAENESPTQKLTDKQIQSLKSLLKMLVEMESIPWKIVKHRKKKY